MHFLYSGINGRPFYLFHAHFLFGLFFGCEAGINMFLQASADFNEVRSVIFLKMEVFITTAVRTSGPALLQTVILK
jgi:hypothetical protein